MGEILQSISEWRWFIAWITTEELPSRINWFNDKVPANEIANWVAKASPHIRRTRRADAGWHMYNMAFRVTAHSCLRWERIPDSSIKINFHPIGCRRNLFFHWGRRHRMSGLEMFKSKLVDVRGDSTCIKDDFIMESFVPIKPKNVIGHKDKDLKFMTIH